MTAEQIIITIQKIEVELYNKLKRAEKVLGPYDKHTQIYRQEWYTISDLCETLGIDTLPF